MEQAVVKKDLHQEKASRQELWTLNGYMSGNQGSDIGMAVVYRNTYGYKLSQWVGWLGYMANYSRNQVYTALGYPQAQEREKPPEGFPQVASQQLVRPERGDVRFAQERGVRVKPARLGQGEQPLDEVVDLFQVIVTPAPDFMQGTPFGVGAFAAVERHQL